MAQFAEINGNRLNTASVVLPYHGIWHVDAQLTDIVSLSGLVTVQIAGLVLKGSVYRIGSFIGSTTVRIIGGYAGWLKTIPGKEYRSSFGINFSVVAGDAARECGEQLSVSGDFGIGQFYERKSGPAVRSLDIFAPVWWMRSDGVTVVGDRPSTTITSAFDVLDHNSTDLGAGRVHIATDKPEDWLPGSKFSSVTLSEQTASAVIHKLDKDKLRTEVWVL